MIQIKERKIILSNSEKKIGVVGDNASTTLEFSLDKIQGDLDISNFTGCALVERSKSNGGVSYSIPITYELISDKIVASLPITSYETKDYGYIYISLRFSDSKTISQISNYDNHVSGTVKATCIGHGFVGTVQGVTIEGTTDYDGVYDITQIDDDNFYFTAQWTTSQYGWCYESTPTVWQTERAMFTIGKGINGEESAEALTPSVFAQQMASLEARCNQIVALFINLCANSGWGSQVEPLLPLTSILESNKSYFGTLGGIYELSIPEVTTIENVIHVYGYCDGTEIDIGTNFTYNQTIFSFESGCFYEIEYRYFPPIGENPGRWGATVVRMGETI